MLQMGPDGPFGERHRPRWNTFAVDPLGQIGCVGLAAGQQVGDLLFARQPSRFHGVDGGARVGDGRTVPRQGADGFQRGESAECPQVWSHVAVRGPDPHAAVRQDGIAGPERTGLRVEKREMSMRVARRCYRQKWNVCLRQRPAIAQVEPDSVAERDLAAR